MTDTTDDNESDDGNVLEPKTSRSPEEVGRAVFRLVRQHDSIRVTRGDSEWDVKIFVDD